MAEFSFRSGERVLLTIDRQQDTLATVIRPFKGYVEVEIERADGTKQKVVVKPSSLKQFKPEEEKRDVTNDRSKPR